jgi:type I site-specific restriction endonuclease
MKIHTYVALSNAEAMYRSPADARKKAIAGLEEQYKDTAAKLKALAEKDKGTAKEVLDALVKFRANLDKCSVCEHKYRNLSIDLTEFEKCRKESCDPLNAARRVIFEKAAACKKGK